MPVDLSRIGLVGQEAYDNSQLSKAQTSLTNMNALAKGAELEEAEQQKEIDALAAQAYSTALQGNGRSSPDEGDVSENVTQADAMDAAASALMSGGAPKRGMELFEAAGKLREAESKLENDKVTRAQNKLENQLKTSDLFYRTIGTSQNQSEYDTSRQYLEESDLLSPEDKKLLSQMPDQWSPELARFWREKAIAAKDQAQLELTERARDQQDTNLSNTAAYRASVLAQQDARLQEVKRYHDLQTKGGKSAGAPNEQELKTVATMVKSQIPALAKTRITFGTDESYSPDEITLQAGSIAVASAAKKMMLDNPSLTWSEATSRALIQSKANGDWNIPKVYRKTFLGQPYGDRFTEEDSSFNPTGKSKEYPAPLPPKGTKPVKGQYYITVKGRAKWNGTSFEIAE